MGNENAPQTHDVRSISAELDELLQDMPNFSSNRAVEYAQQWGGLAAKRAKIIAMNNAVDAIASGQLTVDEAVDILINVQPKS
jgi:hypothetical protein